MTALSEMAGGCKTLLAAPFVICALALSLGPEAAKPSTSDQGTASCPDEIVSEHSVASRNRSPRSRRVLLPSGPLRMILCRYYGHGEQPPKTPKGKVGKLAGASVQRDRSLVRDLADEFRQIPLEPKEGEFGSCAFDEGARLYAMFRYAGKPPVFLEVRLSGCANVTNGHRSTRQAPSRFLRRLEAMTGSTND